MSEQEIPETSGVTSIEEAERIVNLGGIMINNPLHTEADQNPSAPLFSIKQQIGKENFWWLLLQKHKAIPKASLEQIGSLLATQKIQADIRRVHDKILGTTVHPINDWFTSAMIYPLMDRLITTPADSSQEVFEEWRDNWLSGVDPEKFSMAMSLYFQILSFLPIEAQKELIANIQNQPIQATEAEILAGLFEKVYGENYDITRIQQADIRNRKFIDKVAQGNTHFTSSDLFHTTDLTTLPLIIDKGLLATECTSLTMDWAREAAFAISFWTFKQPPNSLDALGERLKKGPETYRRPSQRIHLAFLNPQAATDTEYILYPPDSFWLNRATRKNNVAGRYIGGYDGSDSDFPNKAPAYVLIGLPSTAVSFVVLDEKLQGEYAAKAKDFPFYIPAYSYEGKLIYTPQEYDAAKTA